MRPVPLTSRIYIWKIRLNKEQRTWYTCCLLIIKLYESLSLASAANTQQHYFRILDRPCVRMFTFLPSLYHQCTHANWCIMLLPLFCEIYMWQFYGRTEHLIEFWLIWWQFSHHVFSEAEHCWAKLVCHRTNHSLRDRNLLITQFWQNVQLVLPLQSSVVRHLIDFSLSLAGCVFSGCCCVRLVWHALIMH